MSSSSARSRPVERSAAGRRGVDRAPRADWSPRHGRPAPGRHRARRVPTASSSCEASYGGKQAAAVISVKRSAGPDAADAAWSSLREPGGQYLPVGQPAALHRSWSRRRRREPAANVRWPENFENEYVRWQAPVLTAKKRRLHAVAAGRGRRPDRALPHARPTCRASSSAAIPKQRLPVAVKILSDQIIGAGPSVRFPVGRHVRRLPRRGPLRGRLHAAGDQEGDATARPSRRQARR